MIDIHSHILPSVDDGARDVSETFDMIKEAEKAGYTDIISTSHYKENVFELSKKDRKKIIDALNTKLEEKNIKVKIHMGAEIFIFEEMVEKIKKGLLPTLAESKYILFEIPMYGKMKLLYMDFIIDELIKNKYIPILAHPERYDLIRENFDYLYELKNKGVLLQSNISSITGEYGRDSKVIIKKMLKAGLITFLSTDAHKRLTRYNDVNKSLKLIEKEIGKDKLEELTYYNPKKILNDKEILA